mgnify:CR=1 FL=1
MLRVENRREVEATFLAAVGRATWVTFQIATLGSLLAALMALSACSGGEDPDAAAADPGGAGGGQHPEDGAPDRGDGDDRHACVDSVLARVQG